jgi:predicted nucleotidyltransferase
MRDDALVVLLDDRLPPVDFGAAARERLARALDREGVVAAYLFGSQATGSATPLSDVDVAVWLEPALVSERRWKLLLELQGAAVEAIRHESVDVVSLQDASALLRHRAIRDKQTLVDRRPSVRVDLEARAILEYLDTEHLRAELARGLRDRLAEGRFGRR